MQILKPIQYGSTEYAATLALRNKVMRIPLGLDIYKEDFSCEATSEIIGMFEEDTLLGVGVMSHSGSIYKIEYLCVDTVLQSNGIGGVMLEHLVETARQAGAEKITLDARVKAQRFYERHGFTAMGEIFFMAIAPVEHIVMEKDL